MEHCNELLKWKSHKTEIIFESSVIVYIGQNMFLKPIQIAIKHFSSVNPFNRRFENKGGVRAARRIHIVQCKLESKIYARIETRLEVGDENEKDRIKDGHDV